MDGWMSLFEKGSPPFFGQCSKESFFLWDFGPAKIIEVTEAEKKSSSHPSAEVSSQSKRKKRESREAPPPLLRLLSGQPSSKTYALLRNGLTVITLLKVLDWVAKQLSWANLSFLFALVPWERHMVSVCLMGSCKTLKWIVKKIQYFQIRLFRPMQDGWWLVRLWTGRQRCAGSSKRLLFTGLSSFFSPLLPLIWSQVQRQWLPQQIWVAITRLSIQLSYRRRLARVLLVSTFYIDGGSKKKRQIMILTPMIKGACVWAAIAITCHQIYQYLRYLSCFKPLQPFPGT